MNSFAVTDPGFLLFYLFEYILSILYSMRSFIFLFYESYSNIFVVPSVSTIHRLMTRFLLQKETFLTKPNPV